MRFHRRYRRHLGFEHGLRAQCHLGLRRGDFHRCSRLGLARRGLGQVWPNPTVGCVLVKDGEVVGRGWTQPGGRPHGETEALARLRAMDERGAPTAIMVLLPLFALANLVYCTVQYNKAPSDYNSIASQRRAAPRNRSHKMFLVQEIQAADCMKYFCLHPGRKVGEMNA